MAVTESGNYFGWYDTSRPIMLIYKSTLQNTINLIYVMQVEDPLTNAWVTVTEQMKQPIEWSANEFRIDPSQLCTDYVDFGVAQSLVTNIRAMPNHVAHCRLLMVEQQIDLTTNLLEEYESDTSTWQVMRHFYGIDNSTMHEETFDGAQHTWCYPYYLWTHNWSSSTRNTCKMITDMPLVTNQCAEDNMFLSFGTMKKNLELSVDVYRADGTIHYGVIMSGTLGTRVTQFGIGVPQLHDYLTSQGTIATYYTTANPWTKIKWRWADASSGIVYTTDYTMNIEDCGCTKEHIRLWWRNSRNGIDSHTFKGTYSEKVKSSFEKFQQPLGFKRVSTEDNTGQHWGINNTFNQQKSGLSKVNIRAAKQIQVHSGWNNEEHNEWLAQILTSTNVWIEDRTQTNPRNIKLTPLILKTSDIITKPLNARLAKLKLTFDFANPRTVNRI